MNLLDAAKRIVEAHKGKGPNRQDWELLEEAVVNHQLPCLSVEGEDDYEPYLQAYLSVNGIRARYGACEYTLENVQESGNFQRKMERLANKHGFGFEPYVFEEEV